MTERKPVESVLEPALDEAGVARVWRRLGERRAARVRTRAARLFVGVALAAGAVAAVLVAAIALRAPRPLAAQGGGPSVAPGASVVAPAETAVPLDDGSTVTLARGAKLEVLSNDGERFVTLLRSGRASYEVVPGGPRRWVVETDLATIEVVGTGFEVEREDRRGLTVSVRHGVVMVRGERVPGRVQRLVAGEKLTVAPAVTAVTAVVTAAAVQAPAVEAPAVEAPAVEAPAEGNAGELTAKTPRTPGSDKADPELWRSWRLGGSPPDGIAARRAPAPEPTVTAPAATVVAVTPPPVAVTPPSAPETPEQPAAAPPAEQPAVAEAPMSLREAVAAADQLRRGGRAREAAELLERALAEAPGDPMAGVAAFSLGRMQLDILGQPLRAAASFAIVLRVGPQTLVEDAHLRRIAALAAAGRRDEARAAARAYTTAFPDGERAAQVRALLGEP